MASTDVAASERANDKAVENLESVVIRFCGDSGDGMQLVGTQFTNVSAAFGKRSGCAYSARSSTTVCR